ncbi:hypothetical protein HTIA_p3042 (plasmid) [Halorhabdus tiamatea SARL4B]|uniref:Uncharacterized protein n=1 Tax=Halorhabdus tiamatea SARL4B TaxID=1033806 RepID=S6CVH2_9EURY|nr:hypothetical protein HTIA_p3042 [Halorhabdus tiamatea SARL4B]
MSVSSLIESEARSEGTCDQHQHEEATQQRGHAHCCRLEAQRLTELAALEEQERERIRKQ